MSTRTEHTYLIVGGGMAADAAARGIRELDGTGSIGIVAAEQDPPATRPALSKKLWTDPGFAFEQIWTNTEQDTGATRYAELRAVSIDRATRTVRTADGRELGYTSLLLATGGTPRTLDLPADDRVIDFRTVEDYRRLRARSGHGRRVAVVGGSFIGTELAAALVQNETRTTLVFPDDVLGGAVFPADLAARFQRLFADAGVELLPGVRVEGGHLDPEAVTLELSDGTTTRAPTVVVGLGIRPNDDLAKAAGLAVEDGVVVDDRLRTSDPLVFAAGDVASYPDAILGRRRIEHVDNATHMGHQAGRNMAGADEPYDYTPYFYSVVFGNRYEAVGTLDASMTTVEDWTPGGHAGVVYYVDGGRVAGVLLWNVDDARDAARDVIAHATDTQALHGRIPLP